MPTDHTFVKDSKWFVRQMCSRKRMLPAFTHFSVELSERAEKDLEKFIDLHGEDKIFNEEGKLTQYSINPEFMGRQRYLKQTFDDFSIFTVTLPKMGLVSLVSLYDAYLAKILRNIFKIKPEILNGCGRNLTFAELCRLENLSDARNYIVEQEIESLLRSSHTDQIEWIESRLQIKLRDLPAWKCFVEITERRNLLVHADGIVSQQYIDVCKKSDCLDTNIKLGDRLIVSPDYYDDACTYITEIGVKLSQVIWRKLRTDELEDCDIAFNNVGFDLLVEKEYRLAEQILALSDVAAFKKSSAKYGLYMLINRCIALRGQEKFEECIKLLDTMDWSAISLKFQLANLILREDYDSAVQIMQRLGAHDEEVGQAEYKNWPLFRWFRKTDKFKKAYEEIFGEPYTITAKTSIADDALTDGPDDPTESIPSDQLRTCKEEYVAELTPTQVLEDKIPEGEYEMEAK